MIRFITTAVLCTSLYSQAHAACEARNFVVAVDSGHSPSDGGSTSARGKSEFEFNDTLAREVVSALKNAGYGQAFLLNPYRSELSLHERTKLADGRGAGLFLSIHHDSTQPHYLNTWTHEGQEQRYSDDFSGFSLWVSGSTVQAARSLTTAKAIGEGLLKRGLAPTLHHAEPIAGESRKLIDTRLGIYRRDTLAVLRASKAPAVLVEAGVIVNRAEELRLEQAGHRARIVAAVVEGAKAACAATP